MGRGKREAGQDAASGGADGGGAAAAAKPAAELKYECTDCGLCKHAMDVEGEEHIVGVCTVCKKIPLHIPCAIDYLHKALKADNTGSKKSLQSMLLVADNRPWVLLDAGDKTPKWMCLRKCCVCQDGVMTAEKCKPTKAAEPPPAPDPRPRPPPAPKPAPTAKRPAAQPQPPRRVYEAGPTPAARLHGSASASAVGTFAADQEQLAREAARRLRGSASAGAVGTFAAEQERAAKAAARREEEQRRERARAQEEREQREAERLSRLSQAYEEQIAALMGAEGSPGGGGAGSDAGSQASGQGSEDIGVWWPSPGVPQPLPLRSGSGSPAPVATPQLSHAGSTAGSMPAWDVPAAEPGGAVWLPEAKARQEAPPEEEIDELMAMLGIA